MSGLAREYYEVKSVRTGLNRKEKNELIARKHELERLIDIKNSSTIVYGLFAQTYAEVYQKTASEAREYADELRQVRTKLAGEPVEIHHYENPGRPRKKIEKGKN